MVAIKPRTRSQGSISFYLVLLQPSARSSFGSLWKWALEGCKTAESALLGNCRNCSSCCCGRSNAHFGNCGNCSSCCCGRSNAHLGNCGNCSSCCCGRSKAHSRNCQNCSSCCCGRSKAHSETAETASRFGSFRIARPEQFPLLKTVFSWGSWRRAVSAVLQFRLRAVSYSENCILKEWTNFDIAVRARGTVARVERYASS